MDLFRPIWINFNLFRPILTHLDQFGSLWTHLNQFGHIMTQLSHLDPFIPFWKSLTHFGSIWTYFYLYGPIWTNLVPFGAVWSLWTFMILGWSKVTRSGKNCQKNVQKINIKGWNRKPEKGWTRKMGGRSFNITSGALEDTLVYMWIGHITCIIVLQLISYKCYFDLTCIY